MSDSYPRARYLPAGDLALSVELGNAISVELNTRVRQFEYLLEEAKIPGIRETVPTYRALLVYYDPLTVEYDALVERLKGLEANLGSGITLPGRLVELPCCYDPELGFDLEAVAQYHGLTPQEVARIHASAEYLTYFIGFTPGLPYMGGLPEQIAIPRLVTPRANTPPGSVGIGGNQCCVYSLESPGGFWVLGRTPLRPYNPAEAEPILLRAGDHVRFRPVGRTEYEEILAAVEAGTFRPKIELLP